jgi:hypothetical protein
MTLLISFSFNQAIILLYKYLCLGFNKSVFNRTFCKILHLKKNPIAQKYTRGTLTKSKSFIRLTPRVVVNKIRPSGFSFPGFPTWKNK